MRLCLWMFALAKCHMSMGPLGTCWTKCRNFPRYVVKLPGAHCQSVPHATCPHFVFWTSLALLRSYHDEICVSKASCTWFNGFGRYHSTPPECSGPCTRFFRVVDDQMCKRLPQRLKAWLQIYVSECIVISPRIFTLHVASTTAKDNAIVSLAVVSGVLLLLLVGSLFRQHRLTARSKRQALLDGGSLLFPPGFLQCTGFPVDTAYHRQLSRERQRCSGAFCACDSLNAKRGAYFWAQLLSRRGKGYVCTPVLYFWYLQVSTGL